MFSHLLFGHPTSRDRAFTLYSAVIPVPKSPLPSTNSSPPARPLPILGGEGGRTTAITTQLASTGTATNSISTSTSTSAFLIVSANATAPPGKKMIKRTITVIEKVARETVKAEQGLPVDLTLPKYNNDRRNYELSFKTNTRAGDGTTVLYTSVPASGDKRRLSEEGSSKAEWTLMFDDDVDVAKVKELVVSKEFSDSISASTGLSVTEAKASVATVQVEVKVKKVVFLLVDDIDSANAAITTSAMMTNGSSSTMSPSTSDKIITSISTSASISMTASTFTSNITRPSNNTALPAPTGIDHVHACRRFCLLPPDKTFLPRSLIPSMNLRVYTHKQSQRRRNLDIRQMAAHTHQVQHACGLLATPNAVSLPTSFNRSIYVTTCSVHDLLVMFTNSINEFARLHQRTVTTTTKTGDSGSGGSDASGSAYMRNSECSVLANIVHSLYIRHDIKCSCII